MLEQYSFGYWLRLKRKALDLTREGLANRVGCSIATIRKIEAEERRPSEQIVERLANVFNISQDERSAFLRFARGDWKSSPSNIHEDRPWRASLISPRSNLPARTTSLIGREHEISLVRRYLLNPDVRLISLIGPPGIGKTRLSLEATWASLADFSEGVFFVGLATLEDASLIPTFIAQALGFVEAKDVPTLEQLEGGIGDKQILLVLDNCEHLIETVATLASDLLLACPRLKILVTSRESLRVPGEWIYPVPPLDVPQEGSSIDAQTASRFAALALFMDRARAMRPDFVLNAENVHIVSSICSQLDGLPLAIELIAVRTRLMSPRALLENLKDQSLLTVDEMRARPERQKTLNNAIDWSYKLLPPDEQNLFMYLSVFSGGFTLEAAETIFSSSFAGKSVPNLILSLVDKNLLQKTFDRSGEIRFGMLVTIHSFASQRLKESGRAAAMRDQHASYFLELAEEADKYVHSPDQRAWMDRLDAELDNFRAALDWYWTNKHTDKLLQLFAALNWTWLLRWSPSEGHAWLEKIETLPDIADHLVTYARVLNTAVRREWLANNLVEARALLEKSHAIWLELKVDGERGLADVLSLSGMLARSSEASLPTAASYFEQSFELYQKCDDKWGMAFTRFGSGCIAFDRGEDDAALAWLKQSFDLFQGLGDLWGMGRTSQFLGQLALKEGRYEEAHKYFEQHLRVDEGFKEGTVIALYNLGNLYRHQHDYDQAEQYYKQSLSMCREFGLKIDGGYNVYALGMLALHRDNYPLAKQYFSDYFNLANRPPRKNNVIGFLMGSAAVAGGLGRYERAAKLSGAAQAIVETGPHPIDPLDRAEFDRHIRVAADQLGQASFATLETEGRALTMEQAVEYALE